MTNKEIENLQKYLNHKKLPKKVQISTITLTCKIDAKFNNLNIERYLDLDNEVVTIKSPRIQRSSLPPKKQRKTKSQKPKKQAFYNQVSIGLHKDTDDIKKTINIKLFINGAMQLTGCKSLDDFNWAVKTLFKKLNVVKAIYDSDQNILIEKPFVNDNKILHISKVTATKICMINSNFNMDYVIDRENLYHMLIDDKYSCTYDPIMHACVNIKYDIGKTKKASIFVFEKGTIIITGVKDFKQISKSYKFIKGYLNDNYNSLVKRSADEGNIIDDLIKELDLE